MSYGLNAWLAPGPLHLSPRAVSDAAPEAIVMVDSAQRIVAVNAAAERMLRAAAPELTGAPLGALLPAHLRERHAEQAGRFTHDGHAELPMHQRQPLLGLRADGETFPVGISLSRIELQLDGRTWPLIVAQMRDLQAELTLRDRVTVLAQQVRALLEASPVALWIVDKGVIVFANRAALQLMQVDSDDGVLGRPVFERLSPGMHAGVQAQIERAQSTGDGGGPVAGQLLRDGHEPCEVEVTSSGLPDHGQALVQMAVTDTTRTRAQVREEQRYRSELRRLSASVLQAREDERRHIARELHDELGQHLSALKLELAGLQLSGAVHGAQARIEAMQLTIDDAVASVRRIAADLRPLVLDDLGLDAAIEWLGRDAERRTGIPVAILIDVDAGAIDERTATGLYRIVQESLDNVGRHARASGVWVSLRSDGEALVLTVRDDGVGFPPYGEQHEGRVGIVGMRERARLLGGRLALDNLAGGGARVTVRVPYGPRVEDGGGGT